MSNLFSKMAIRTYETVGMAAYPFMGPFLRFRASRGKEDRKRRYERYGYPSTDKPSGPTIWFHAASVGEAIAVIPLIEHVNSLELNTIMTTGTVTSAKVVRSRLPNGAFHQYVPLDLKPALQRFLDHWKPDMAIFAESEIWPTTMMELTKRGIPRILVNARMSDRSFKRWSNSGGLGSALFENLSHVIAQSELDAERFKKLGARPVDVSGNLKVDTDMLPFDETEFNNLQNRIGTRPCWLAASTHDGEEAIAGEIHKALKQRLPNLLTVIVPRHPERADAIEKDLQEKGLKIAKRSQNQKPEADTDVYLGDTIGEMGLYLRIAQVVFVGKSLKSTGGQNPLEPAMIGTPIVSGHAVHNFRDTYRKLLEDRAVRLVSDQEMLRANVEYLLLNPAERKRMVDAAFSAIKEMQGSLKKTQFLLDAYFFPLTVKSGLEEFG